MVPLLERHAGNLGIDLIGLRDIISGGWMVRFTKLTPKGESYKAEAYLMPEVKGGQAYATCTMTLTLSGAKVAVSDVVWKKESDGFPMTQANRTKAVHNILNNRPTAVAYLLSKFRKMNDPNTPKRPPYNGRLPVMELDGRYLSSVDPRELKALGGYGDRVGHTTKPEKDPKAAEAAVEKAVRGVGDGNYSHMGTVLGLIYWTDLGEFSGVYTIFVSST